ncbi:MULTISPECIES: hypothetical protein [Streptomycetaceae]|uniref:Uncharacterized protein n=1 Tax=Streptantibioticus cattleyicolor (strain ATCC 35852 / DSM 46488 / JCM 4925 / NBRC 14057 / NRRL 8057) TaxID=1003195 RepID=F8K1U5_STREN|nr:MULTISPECIES: hypothetical protein [Streptomycetaceae]AEW92415.1 hypothetical protein SCATT_00440 [Streptantibioticus cattleyicolor NRRL 8057 = DSM 46488]CCB72779.1 protein of unknown function [Streptantibioticus cattleyicolor NRRL 8057 = DSM 46488]
MTGVTSGPVAGDHAERNEDERDRTADSGLSGEGVHPVPSDPDREWNIVRGED